MGHPLQAVLSRGNRQAPSAAGVSPIPLAVAVSTLLSTTIRKYRSCTQKPPSQTWRSFLNNHVKDIAAIDFFTIPTVNFRRFELKFDEAAPAKDLNPDLDPCLALRPKRSEELSVVSDSFATNAENDVPPPDSSAARGAILRYTGDDNEVLELLAEDT